MKTCSFTDAEFALLARILRDWDVLGEDDDMTDEEDQALETLRPKLREGR
ncbi:hypothetical protein KW797_00170 [Candidatus Parcubacteria bacterium]|nr:hypothetical protein [Candidatus Parcubacteria bacterium]